MFFRKVKGIIGFTIKEKNIAMKNDLHNWCVICKSTFFHC